MGTFVLSPIDRSDVTFSMMEDHATDYQVIPTSIDLHENERLKIVYSVGNYGGYVNSLRRGLVPVDFRVVIFGDTQAAALDNLRTLTHAVTNPKGGWFKYKPLGLAASVMDTYYKYLRSAPPKMIAKGANADTIMDRYGQFGRAQGYGIVVDVTLVTRAVGISNPFSPATIVASTTIDNCDDSSNDNYVSIAAASIKGDAVIPIITVDPVGVGAYNQVILHHWVAPSSNNTDKDVYKVGPFTIGSGSWTYPADTTASEGYRADCTSASGYIYEDLDQFDLDSSYIGKITPFLNGRTSSSGTTYDVRITFYLSAYEIVSTAYKEFIYSVGNNWRLLSFDEVDFPPFTIPEYIDDGTTPSISQYMGNARIRIEVTRTAGSGNLELDFIWIPKSENFIAIFDVRSTITGYLEIDALSGTFNELASGGTKANSKVTKYGESLNNLELIAGMNHRLRFFLTTTNASVDYYYDISDTMDVEVKGVYATIYPFEES